MSESVPQPGDTVTVAGITHRDGSPLVFPVLGHRKRGGRKPGSKNRPKTDQGKEVAKLKAEIASLQERLKPQPPKNPGFGEIEYADLSPMVGVRRICNSCLELYCDSFESHRAVCQKKPLKERCEVAVALLERAIAIRISAMDSDSRLTAKIRELQAIASEAVQMLKVAQ